MIVLAVVAIARVISGSQSRWIGCDPSPRQRIYFANHTSHLDFVALWAALPRELRALTRPVAGRDYWDRGGLRRYLAVKIFRAVLVDRGGPASAGADGAAEKVATARRMVAVTVEALETRDSLIIFPEGTRGDGGEVAPFKSGLYHLCRQRPDVELVPSWLENLNRILPKGEILPVPLMGSVTFGPPLHLESGEDKAAFLTRARNALQGLRRS